MKWQKLDFDTCRKYARKYMDLSIIVIFPFAIYEYYDQAIWIATAFFGCVWLMTTVQFFKGHHR